MYNELHCRGEKGTFSTIIQYKGFKIIGNYQGFQNCM